MAWSYPCVRQSCRFVPVANSQASPRRVSSNQRVSSTNKDEISQKKIQTRKSAKLERQDQSLFAMFYLCNQELLLPKHMIQHNSARSRAKATEMVMMVMMVVMMVVVMRMMTSASV